MNITRSLLAEAAMHGITVETAADRDQDAAPGIVYAVQGPGGRSTAYDSADAAASDIRARIGSIQDAAEAAMNRAEQWRELSDSLDALRELTAAVNALLPEGCTVPLPPSDSLYSPATLPPLPAAVAQALAGWERDNRDRAAREQLTAALRAEGAELTVNHEQVERWPEFWDERVTVWRPVALVPEISDASTIRRGRTIAGEGSRREVAWRLFGVAVVYGTDAVDAAVAQLDRSREIVQRAAAEHTEAANRISDRLSV